MKKGGITPLASINLSCNSFSVLPRVYILVWYILCPPPPRTRVYILVRYILLQMGWRRQTLPFFFPDHVQLVRPRLAETSASCPPDLVRELAANNLVPDEQTARDGNCGIDAFARSLLAQMQNGQGATCRTESARRRRDLHKARDKLIGCAKLECNGWKPTLAKSSGPA